jgi:hypothetical protein
LEFLRESHGHRHLGISAAQMRSWAAEAGLEIETARTLRPPRPAGADQLTVALWLLRAQSRGATARAAVA